MYLTSVPTLCCSDSIDNRDLLMLAAVSWLSIHKEKSDHHIISRSDLSGWLIRHLSCSRMDYWLASIFISSSCLTIHFSYYQNHCCQQCWEEAGRSSTFFVFFKVLLSIIIKMVKATDVGARYYISFTDDMKSLDTLSRGVYFTKYFSNATTSRLQCAAFLMAYILQ